MIFPISFIFISVILFDFFCRHKESNPPTGAAGSAWIPAAGRSGGGSSTSRQAAWQEATTWTTLWQTRWWKTCWGWRILGGQVSQLTFVYFVMHSWSLKFYIETSEVYFCFNAFICIISDNVKSIWNENAPYFPKSCYRSYCEQFLFHFELNLYSKFHELSGNPLKPLKDLNP